MNISGLSQQMFLLFGIIIIGYIATKCKKMDSVTNQKLSTLISCVTNPLQVVSSVLQGERPLENSMVLKITGIACCIYLVLIFLAKALPRIFRARNGQEGVYQFLFIFANVGYMGYPVIEALLGTEYLFCATIFVMTFQLFCWSYGVSLLSGEKKISWKAFLRPMIVAALLAYGIYFANIQVPPVCYRLTKTVGSITSPMAMLIIGCSLAQLSLKEVFGKWQMYVLSALKLLLLPIAGWFVLRLFITDKVLLGVFVVTLAMPSATNATIISYQYGGDEKMASSGVFLTTLFSVATIPFVMWLLF